MLIKELFASENNPHPIDIHAYFGMDELFELFDGEARVDLELMDLIGDEFDLEDEVWVLRWVVWFHDLNF